VIAGVARDVVLGWRALRARPGLTCAAVLSMALGIGSNTAIFRLYDAALLRPLPVRDPATLVAVYGTRQGGPRQFLPLSYPSCQEIAAASRSFSGLAAYQWLRLELAGGEQPRKGYVQVVSEEYFEVLGVPAALGRTFTREDSLRAGGAAVAVVSDAFWRRDLGGDPRVLGRTVRVAGRELVVVGVAPLGFRGTRALTGAELWVPMSVYDQLSPYARLLRERGAQMFELVGRLRPGVAPRAAQAELATLAAHFEREHPATDRGKGLLVLPLGEASVEPWQRPFFVRAGLLLQAAMGLLLLIACGNVASLLLTRGLEQRREVLIRLAVGGRRGRLVRQLLVQSLLLALAGGALGLLVGWRISALLWRFRPPDMFSADALEHGFDGRVLLFGFLLALAAALLFGLAPALRATRPDLAAVLKEETPAAPRALGPRASLRDLLVAAQAALCFLSLAGAVLAAKSLLRVERLDPGFDAGHLLVASYAHPDRTVEPARALAFHQRVLETMAGVPGVRAAALASYEPLSAGPPVYLNVKLGQEPGREGALVLTNVVTPGYFATLGIPLRRGRDFGAGDRPETRSVAIVNETMARLLRPDGEALGAHFQVKGAELEVVGLAADSRYGALAEDPQPCLYLPLAQRPGPAALLHLRTVLPAAAFRAHSGAALRRWDRLPTLYDLHAMDDTVRASLWAQRLSAALLGLFGAVSLVLAATGIHAVLTASVQQGRRELGVRMAMGARPRAIVGLVVRRAMLAVAGGFALGLLAAAASGRLVEGFLYGLRALDPRSLAEVGALLGAVALAAAAGAARRVAWLEPMQALRPRSEAR
jgi:predicted permease